MRTRRIFTTLTASLALLLTFAPAALAASPSRMPQTNQYAALGDSVAAGLGLPLSATATPTDQLCGRSPSGYPGLVTQQTGLALVNATCAGATVGDLFTKQHVLGTDIPAQLRTAFASGTPKLITITAGANDAHWADFIKACYASTCDTDSYSYIASAYLAGMKAKLHYAFSDIRFRSHGNPPQVIITGYYYPFSPACAAIDPRITPSELSWLQSETQNLNAAIQRVASHYSFVRFAPLSFAGHDLCSGSSWIQGPSDPAPFHPTAAGQQAIAQAVLATYRP